MFMHEYKVFNGKFKSKVQHCNIIVKRNMHMIIVILMSQGGNLVALGYEDMPLIKDTFMSISYESMVNI